MWFSHRRLALNGYSDTPVFGAAESIAALLRLASQTPHTHKKITLLTGAYRNPEEKLIPTKELGRTPWHSRAVEQDGRPEDKKVAQANLPADSQKRFGFQCPSFSLHARTRASTFRSMFFCL